MTATDPSSAAVPSGSLDRLPSPRDLAQLHRDLWTMVRARPLIFVLLPSVLWLPFDLVSEYITSGSDDLMGQLRTAQRIGNIGNLAVGVFLMSLFPVVLKSMAQGRQVTLGDAIAEAKTLWAGVLGVTMLSGFLAVLALLAFVLPGIYAAVCFSLVVPVVVFENVRGMDALKRSRSLVQSRGFFTVFGYGAAFYALYLVLSLSAAAGISLSVSALGIPEHWVISALTSIPVNIVSSALVLGATMLYVDSSGQRALSPVGTDLVTDDGRRVQMPASGIRGLVIATALAATTLLAAGVALAVELANEEVADEIKRIVDEG